MTIPPFCPEPSCRFHSQEHPDIKWFRTAGCYYAKAFGTVRRYLCLHCGKWFSDQTFSLDYFVKRPVSYQVVFNHINAGSGLRAIGRALGVNHHSIMNRISRLARQGIAFQAELTRDLGLTEDVAADGIESFVEDQYQPNNINLLVGSHSQFLYDFDYAHLRRKGCMTEYQKQQREIREQSYIRKPISIPESFERIMDTMKVHYYKTRGAPFTLYTDEKLEYSRVIQRDPELQFLMKKKLFTHTRINSKYPRVGMNPLFPVNYFDREIRKDNANHVRETVQFSRDVNYCMDRMAVYQLYHNYCKPYRIDDGDLSYYRHGEIAGISRELIDKGLATIFRARRFYTHVILNASQGRVWFRMVGNLSRLSGGYWPHYVKM